MVKKGLTINTDYVQRLMAVDRENIGGYHEKKMKKKRHS